MIRIEVKFNNVVLKEFESDQKEITIGRSEDNDIPIDNMAVSGEHAKIVQAEGPCHIVDLASTNGTFVNEKRIFRCDLKEGDRITIGKHTLVISFKTRVDAKELGIRNIERTYKLDTQKHKEMLNKKRK